MFSDMQPYLKLRVKSFRFYLSLIVVISFLTLFYFHYQINKSFSSKSNIVYSIVIDAGSTGSRIHVFRLHHNKGINIM